MWTWNRHRSRIRGGLIAALDVGSSKVCCAISQVQGDDYFEILGVGQQLSNGVKSGIVIDMEDAVTSIVNAVHTAEKMAGVTIKDVIVSVNGMHLKSVNFAVEMSISGHPIDEADVRRIILQAKSSQENAPFQTLHTFPTGYSLDGAKGIRDPRGMKGEHLGVSIHTLLSKITPLHNLSTCVARSHLEVAGLVAAPYASGLACLVEDEMNLGSILIEMGGSITSFSIFHGGQLRYTECIPLGGDHVTMDIARCFSTTLSHAERLKTLYGSATPSVSDDREIVNVPVVGEGRGQGTNQMPRSNLVAVIKPRIEEIFEKIRDRLRGMPAGSFIGRVVLTGGASQLGGVREIAAMILSKNVRLGKPLQFGYSDLSQDPSFSTCAGLLAYGQAEHLAFLHTLPQSASKRVVAHIGNLLKQIW